MNKFNNKCANAKDEYALSYGEKYCEKFRVSYSQFSPQAQQWIDKVRKCLQQELAPYVGSEIFCGQLRDVAFDSHKDCYINSGLCKLKFEEQKKVLGVVKSAFNP